MNVSNYILRMAHNVDGGVATLRLTLKILQPQTNIIYFGQSSAVLTRTVT